MQEVALPNLSEAHSSRIRITLTLLDEALVKFEEWAQGREVRSILYHEANTLDPDRRAEILADVAGIRGIMQELKDDLYLKAGVQNIAKAMRGHCYILWVDVLEMTSNLDPKTHHILKYIDHIKALLTKPGS